MAAWGAGGPHPWVAIPWPAAGWSGLASPEAPADRYCTVHALSGGTGDLAQVAAPERPADSDQAPLSHRVLPFVVPSPLCTKERSVTRSGGEAALCITGRHATFSECGVVSTPTAPLAPGCGALSGACGAGTSPQTADDVSNPHGQAPQWSGQAAAG